MTCSKKGVDFKVSMMDAPMGERVKLTIWDTAGQERFRTLTKSYFRGASAALMVYDVTREDTFAGLEAWLEEVDAHATSDDVVKMLVANKIDLDGERVVSRQQGIDFARRNAMMYIETSARTAEGVKNAFQEVVVRVLETPSLAASTASRSSTSASTIGGSASNVQLNSNSSSDDQPTCMGIQC